MPPKNKRSTRSTTAQVAAVQAQTPSLSREERREDLRTRLDYPLTPYLDQEAHDLAKHWGVPVGSNDWIELMTRHCTIKTMQKNLGMPTPESSRSPEAGGEGGAAGGDDSGDADQEHGDADDGELSSEGETHPSTGPAGEPQHTARGPPAFEAPVQSVTPHTQDAARLAQEGQAQLVETETEVTGTRGLEPVVALETGQNHTTTRSVTSSPLSSPPPLPPSPKPKQSLRGRPRKTQAALPSIETTRKTIGAKHKMQDAEPNQANGSPPTKKASTDLGTAVEASPTLKRKAETVETDDDVSPRRSKRLSTAGARADSVASSVASSGASRRSSGRLSAAPTGASTIKREVTPASIVAPSALKMRRSQSIAPAPGSLTPMTATTTTPPPPSSTHASTSASETRSHTCSYCERGFSRQEHLTRHVNSIHEKKIVATCENCGHGFTRKDNMTQHQRSCLRDTREDSGVKI